MDRAAKRAVTAAASTRAAAATCDSVSRERKTAITSQVNLTTRRDIAKPHSTSGPSAPTEIQTTAIVSPSSGTKFLNSGSQRPSTTSAASSGSSFNCNCGRVFLSKATLARHQKECGKRDTSACQHCGQQFPTFAGVRQHERRQHPELYRKELESKLPRPESELMSIIADIEARSTNGVFYKAMVDATGLTKVQVRYRRERPEYRKYLDRAKANINGASPSSAPSRPGPPATPRARRYVSRLQSRNSIDDDALTARQGTATAELAAEPTASTTIPTLKNLVVRLTRISESSLLKIKMGNDSLPHTVEPTQANVLSACAISSPVSPKPSTSHGATTSVDQPVSSTSSIQSLPAKLASRRRLSSSLPSLLTTDRDAGTGYCNNSLSPLEAIRTELHKILDFPPEGLSNTPGVADAVNAALYETNDRVLYYVDHWLSLFNVSSKGAQRRPGGKAKSASKAHYGQTNTGRGFRAAAFKKAQDLYVKNRKGLAEAILEGRDVEERPAGPGIERITDLFGGILERPSPPDEHPFDSVNMGNEDTSTAISPDDIAAAKTGWRVSSAGADGISVQSVKSRSDLELSVLFNIILYRNVQPTTWRNIRTTLVPKGGDLSQPTNWRPISVGSALQRLLHRVLVARLKYRIALSKHQRGFVETDGTLANALILHEYIQHRTELGKGYNVISLDISKAFDTVSHRSIRRALRRFRVPDYLLEYIMSTFEATTTLNIGGSQSRPIKIRSGVRQGDPLSPSLFNLVMDELLENLNEEFRGGSLPNGAHCAAMAFADDLILLTDKELEVPLLLDQVQTFLKHRGMEVNAAKCRALVAAGSGGRSVARTRNIFKINNSPIPAVPSLNAFRYLGHDFGHKGIEKPGLFNLPRWLDNISRAPLKPDQKLAIVKVFVLPRLLYSLQNPKITAQSLRDADRLVRKRVRAMLHLNCHTPDSMIHASVRDGGLGVMEMRTAIPRILLGRMVGLLERSEDTVVQAVLQSDSSRKLMTKLQHLAGDIPGPTVMRGKIASGVLSKGLEQSSEDQASRAWIDARPAGWSGRDYVRAVQLRTANLPTKAIPSNPPELRRCRGGCSCDENISHVLQTCPVTHWERISRHNEIVAKIARHGRSKRWLVEEEPHVRHVGGQLFKPDLVIHQPGNTTVVADVQVAWDAAGLSVAYERKRVVYDNAVFKEAAARRWPGKNLIFAPIIVGARGIWPRINNDRSSILAIPPVVRRSCVNSALKWGSSIHTAFMKAVWRKTNNPCRAIHPRPGE